MKKFFNMIEVTLAIAVVGIGMASIMALFPVGINSSRDAIAENYAADCAEQFIAYIERECKGNASYWANTLQKAYSANGFYTLDVTSGTPFFNQGIETFKPIPVSTEEKNIFHLDTPNANNNSIYRITQGSTICTDFDAVIRIWKTPVVSTLYSGNWTSYTDNPPYSASAGLNFEVSWPTDKPYAARSKKYYYKEIFRSK